MTHLAALANGQGYEQAATADLAKPYQPEQLGDALGCFHLIEDAGGDTVTVVAGCPQDHLDRVVAAYRYDPFYGRATLATLATLESIAEAVIDGKAVFTIAQIQQVLAHLVLVALRAEGR